MLYFINDYMEGAHPQILQRLIETNMEKTPGYGTDDYCETAREKIRAACSCPDAQVWFLAGGTQTNATVIDSVLAGYEGVIAAKTGHISTHEAGAIEASGHKVLELEQSGGKISAQAVREYLKSFYADGTYEHMVTPGMVYISHPTEYGTLYTKDELRAMSEVCREYKIPLYMDGARLGYGLAAETDVTLADIANYCEAFYIGGTKVGALFGEAVVFTPRLKVPRFFTRMKQHGALVAKGRLLGLQFDTLFTDDLYINISAHAVRLAVKLKQAFVQKGYRLFIDSPTNQQFVVLSPQKLAELEQHAAFGVWEKLNKDEIVVRFATSWATDEDDVDKLISLL